MTTMYDEWGKLEDTEKRISRNRVKRRKKVITTSRRDDFGSFLQFYAK